jgi:pSer/pThr/pTyr-binding forkhead associated (FHA) protein
MTGIVIFILRLILAASLYAFLGWALYTIWRDLKLQSQLVASRRIPPILLQPELGGPGVEHEFSSAEFTIGRDPGCESPIAHETVSSRHARLSYHHNQWWLEDLGSTNGTFLNEERVTTPTVVISGDELRCGQAVFHLVILTDRGE